jgi:serine/threonine protein kinase
MIGDQIGKGAEGTISTIRATEAKEYVMTTEVSAKDVSVVTQWVRVVDLEQMNLVIKHGHYGVLDEMRRVIRLLRGILSSENMSRERLLHAIDLYTPFHVMYESESVLVGVDDAISMKRMTGTLREFCMREEVLTAPPIVTTWYVLNAALCTLSMLCIMHSHDTFHCDIKLDNVLFRDVPSPYKTRDVFPVDFVLTDFGHMRTLRRRGIGGLGAQSGTPGSRSPFSYDEDMPEDFIRDSIVPRSIATPHEIWNDYNKIRWTTSKKMQLVKNDIFALGIIMCKSNDVRTRDITRACLFATRNGKGDGGGPLPLWTASDALDAVRSAIDRLIDELPLSTPAVRVAAAAKAPPPPPRAAARKRPPLFAEGHSIFMGRYGGCRGERAASVRLRRTVTQ